MSTDVTDKTFTMTMAQMKAMFDAGVRCGEDAWPTSTPYADFVEAVYEFVNEGMKWGEEGYTDWDVVEAMVKKG
jgi:hypothetical protein